MSETLQITELGTRRRVVLSRDGRTIAFDTTLSEDLIRQILAVKGAEWVKDAIDRIEDPEYLERPLVRLIARFLGPARIGRVLDLGCGGGASSVVLARLGFRVVGVEPSEVLVRIGAQLVRERAVSDRVTLLVGAGEALPIRPGSIDVVMLCAVIEHVPPARRSQVLQEAWRALRPDGLLLIHDTPNALWPFDGHTTGLWFVTWLPSRLAFAYARRWSRIMPREATDEELVSGGLCAPTYWEIRKAIPDAICVNLQKGDDVTFAFEATEHKRRPFLKAVARRAVIAGLQVADWIARQVFGLPAAVVLQNLDLCFQKPSRSESCP